MTRTMHRAMPPKGMALIETWEGRWFPARVPLTDIPHWVTGIDTDARCIPPALETKPYEDPKQGYTSRNKALEACLSWDEEARLSVKWETLAAPIEVYPERNAWYLDEIALITGGGPLLVTPTIEAIAVVVAASDPGGKIIWAAGVTLDEAIERLYQYVHDWWNELALPEVWAS